MRNVLLWIAIGVGIFLALRLGQKTPQGAKPLIGQKAPAFHVAKWIPNKPDTTGKFVLLDFWATWCSPCLRSIPKLNEIQKQFTNQVVVIGITSESESVVRAFYKKHIHYWVGIDPQNVMASEIQLRYIPHVLFVDPNGIVRWQGNPAIGELTPQLIQKLIRQYQPTQATRSHPTSTSKAVTASSR